MERLIIVHWNKSTGPEPLIQYPPERNYPPKEFFLKIWAQHELNKEHPIIELESMLEETNNQIISIIQEFEGEIYFLVIIIQSEKHIADMISSDILAIIGKNLLELINTNKITRAISEAFNTIANYSKLEAEDLVNFFQDKIKYTILQILRNGVISKTELTNILRQEYGFSTVNIDLLLISFIRENLIIKQNIPGSKECYFLVNDLTCARVPPALFHENSAEEKIIEKYKKEFIKFFSNYNCNQEIENKFLINFLIDKEVYTLVKNLRDSALTVKDSLNIINNKEELFEELLDKKIIFEAKGMVYLFSDIRFVKFVPTYIIKILNKRYNNQEISLNQYLTHLKMLIGDAKTYTPSLDYVIV